MLLLYINMKQNKECFRPMRFLKRRTNVSIAPLQQSDISIMNVDPQIKDIIHLVQLTDEDIKYIQYINHLIADHASEIAKRHYEMILQIADVKEIFDRYTVYDRYVPAFINYLNQISRPKIDAQYIAYRKKIGEIHSDISLSDEWFIGSYTRVYEYLTPYIVAEFSSQPVKLAKILLALHRIITFDTILVIKSYREANDYKLVSHISDAMDEITSINQIGELLSVAEKTTNEAIEMEATTEQFSKAIEEIASASNDVSEHTNTMVEQANESRNVVEVSLTSFSTIIQEFQQSKGQFEQLVEKVNNISEVVEFIKSIADETNLLALNASIEAARAGEQGRGFAVVADEVRNLAEQTKESVENITGEMLEVQNDAHHVSSEIEQFAVNLSDQLSQTNESIEAIHDIMKHIHEVKESIESIASVTEKEAVSTEDLIEKMQRLKGQFDHTKEIAISTGKSVFNAGKGINNIRKNSLATIRTPNEEQLRRIKSTEEKISEWLLYHQHSVSIDDE